GPRARRPWCWPWARCSARSRTPSTSCAPAAPRWARSASPRSGRSRPRRGAPRWGRPAGGWGATGRARGAAAGGGRGRGGAGGPGARAGLPVRQYDVVAGLGGRPIGTRSLHAMLTAALADELPPLSFLDLDTDVVERELRRRRDTRRSGPQAENILHDLSATARGGAC